jgi:hypothetical protein
LLITVIEAAEILSIHRTMAYEHARKYLATGGREGIPAFKLGRYFRSPRWAVAWLAATGQLVNLPDLHIHADNVRRSFNRLPVVDGRATGAASGDADRGSVSDDPSPVRVRRQPVRRRAGSLAQLRLLPGD